MDFTKRKTETAIEKKTEFTPISIKSFPSNLHKRLKLEAIRKNRTLHGHIITILREYTTK